MRAARAWGWTTAGLGIVIAMLALFYLWRESVWLGEHAEIAAEGSGPVSAIPLYLIALLGLILLAGGITVSTVHRRN